MRAGGLDRRVELLRATVTEDEFGGEVTAWLTIATVWASKTDISDRERILAGQVGASVTTRFVIRKWSAVESLDSQDRVRCGGRLYDIDTIKEVGSGRDFEITATARTERVA